MAPIYNSSLFHALSMREVKPCKGMSCPLHLNRGNYVFIMIRINGCAQRSSYAIQGVIREACC